MNDNRDMTNKVGESFFDALGQGIKGLWIFAKIRKAVEMWTNVIAEIQIAFGDYGTFCVTINSPKGQLSDIEYVRLWIHYLTGLLRLVKGEELEAVILNDLSTLQRTASFVDSGAFAVLRIRDFRRSDHVKNVGINIVATYSGREDWDRGTFRLMRQNVARIDLSQRPEVFRCSQIALLDYVITKIRSNSKVKEILVRAIKIYIDNFPNPGSRFQIPGVPLTILQKWAVEQAEKDYINASG